MQQYNELQDKPSSRFFNAVAWAAMSVLILLNIAWFFTLHPS